MDQPQSVYKDDFALPDFTTFLRAALTTGGRTYGMEAGFMKRRIIMLLLCAVLAVSLFGCNRDAEFAEAEKVYIAYLEASKISVEELMPYCHYEHEILRGYASEVGEGQLVGEYQILDKNKINDDLYVFKTNITTKNGGENTGYNFVGKIDGKYYVMVNYFEVPEYLQEGLNTDDYTYYKENTLPIEDIIGEP